MIGHKAFPEKPGKCPHCYSSSMKDVEVLGAYDGPLFWECETCGIQLLRFSRRTTDKHLRKVKGLYYDLEEEWMDRICEGLPN